MDDLFGGSEAESTGRPRVCERAAGGAISATRAGGICRPVPLAGAGKAAAATHRSGPASVADSFRAAGRGEDVAGGGDRAADGGTFRAAQRRGGHGGRFAARAGRGGDADEGERQTHGAVHRRDPSLQQGAAGRASARRRGRLGAADWRDDAQPVVLRQRPARLALADFPARTAEQRGAFAAPRLRADRSRTRARQAQDRARARCEETSHRRGRGRCAARTQRAGDRRADHAAGRDGRRAPRRGHHRGVRAKKARALRQGRGPALRHDFRVHQERARERSRLGALLAGEDDRGRRRPALHRAAADHPGQ